MEKWGMKDVCTHTSWDDTEEELGMTIFFVNGERLLEMCASHHLSISNTLFQLQDSHAYTWYKWGDHIIRSQID